VVFRKWKIENGKWREKKDRVDPVARREEWKEKDNAEALRTQRERREENNPDA
jgi:hypothetical protein